MFNPLELLRRDPTKFEFDEVYYNQSELLGTVQYQGKPYQLHAITQAFYCRSLHTGLGVNSLGLYIKGMSEDQLEKACSALFSPDLMRQQFTPHGAMPLGAFIKRVIEQEGEYSKRLVEYADRMNTNILKVGEAAPPKQAIWKFSLLSSSAETIRHLNVPQDAEFINAAYVRGDIVGYFRLDPTKPTEKRSVAVYATGENIDGYPGKYINTIVLPPQESGLVFHVYDVTNHPKAIASIGN